LGPTFHYPVQYRVALGPCVFVVSSYPSPMKADAGRTFTWSQPRDPFSDHFYKQSHPRASRMGGRVLLSAGPSDYPLACPATITNSTVMGGFPVHRIPNLYAVSVVPSSSFSRSVLGPPEAVTRWSTPVGFTTLSHHNNYRCTMTVPS